MTKIKDINVGQRPAYIGSYNTKQHLWEGRSNTIYVANSGSDSISVIDGTTMTKIKDIPVGKHPNYISFSIFSNTIYVANSGSDSISVINGTNNVKLKDIPVGVDPVYMDTSTTNTIYVANSGSDGISVIDGIDNKVVAGVEFNINPSNSGHITCNNIDSPINQYLYVSSGKNCLAVPNKGFEFSNWIEKLGHNATRTVLTSKVSDSPLNFFLDSFGIRPNDTSAALNVTQFGSFTANFKDLPPPISPEYWIPLYGVIVSTIVGWSVPGIIGSIKAKRQRERINQYHKRIDSLDSDGKLDENDIEYLDTLRRDITDAYMKGKISEQQASNLKNEISKTYEDIYKNIIHSLNSKFDSSGNGIEIDKIKNDFTNAYAAGKITEQHYNLLNEKVSDYKNKKNSINKVEYFE
jgi:YVTN family beta-propeller protein